MTQTAHRVRRDGLDVYLMPYTDGGQAVVFEQDVGTFATRRRTVGGEEARTLRERGRSVPLFVTPAWTDPIATREHAQHSTA